MNPSPRRFHYFAYGSNLLSARLRERTPSARVVGPALLKAHELRWHKASPDGSGKCDVIASRLPGRHVLGVVYEIDLAEKPLLDAAEELGIGYAERSAEVTVGGRPISAWLYHALIVDPQIQPYDWYHALVLAGAHEHSLDAHYIEAIRAVRCKPDADPERSARHYRLIAPRTVRS